MQLREIAQACGSASTDDVEVTGVTHVAQWAKPGDIFIALKGVNRDGHEFIEQAVGNGAVAVMGEGLPEGLSCSVPYVRVAHGRQALAAAAAIIQGNPCSQLDVIGVTGTDGKTTTTLLLASMLRASGRRVGLISTVGYQGIDGVTHAYPAHFTTPEAPQLQEILAGLVAEGADTVVLEVSSHALVQERVGGIHFDVGVWTHLSREHLDFHKTMDEYFAAKRMLIERCDVAVLNNDDPWAEQLRGIAPTELSYARTSPAALRATAGEETIAGLQFRLEWQGRAQDVTLPMVGGFNVDNALAALGAVAALGLDVAAAARSLATFAGVPGRMQFVPRSPGQPRVIIDFAHTPDALEKALMALRATTAGSLWCVIGAAGGQRDVGRIAPMGRAAAQNADTVIITEDDSYDTDLEVLMGELQRGAQEVGGQPLLLPDRRAAIVAAITGAAPDDTILLAGKGHEAELMRPTPIPWDEVAEAQQALRQRP